MKKIVPINVDILQPFPEEQKDVVQQLFENEFSKFSKKIIVLDDDPTGIQTVHDVSVYTEWTKKAITSGFKEESRMFFILTNSRGMSSEQTAKVHAEIGRNIASVANELKQKFVLISRGDSTLRGHYPLETEILRKTIESQMEYRFDGEIIYPFFKEGGRYTIEGIHYVREGEQLTPAGLTEFARDKTFGYSSSDLAEWCEEKTQGKYLAKDVIRISLDELRTEKIDTIEKKLLEAHDFNKIIVDSVDEMDVKIFMTAYLRALNAGKNFMFRSAAAVPKALGNIRDKAFLTREELVADDSQNGGLVIIGSHVNKTTMQLNELKNSKLPIDYIEFHVNKISEDGALEEERKQVLLLAEQCIKKGRTAVVYTSRAPLKINTTNKDEILAASVKISDAVTGIVSQLNVKPAFLVAKGGITSSDVGTKGLSVKKARVMGQICPGIPVWMTGQESRFPGMPYVIFPGNVGETETLKEVVETLIKK